MDDAPAHFSIRTKDYLAAKGIKTLPHPPLLRGLGSVRFLALSHNEGTNITGNSVRTEWERVCATIPKDDFAKAFEKWLDRFHKCFDKDGGYIEEK